MVKSGVGRPFLSRYRETEVTGALNCAPTGISSLNLDVYTENGAVAAM
jgi:hypothetical protein